MTNQVEFKDIKKHKIYYICQCAYDDDIYTVPCVDAYVILSISAKNQTVEIFGLENSETYIWNTERLAFFEQEKKALVFLKSELQKQHTNHIGIIDQQIEQLKND